MNLTKNILAIGIFATLLVGCSEDFLVEAPESQIALESFFENEEQCLQATGALYGFVWFNYLDKAMFALGDVYSGNMYTVSEEIINFQNYTVAQNNIRVFEAWSAFYSAIAHSNNYINNLPRIAERNGVEATVIEQCVAEARFARGVAYFHLARLFGSVPIITDGADLVENYIIPRIIEEDVYRFIIEDFEYAEEHSPEERTGTEAGRVTTYAAKAMLAKVYLRQKEYASAKTKLEDVIASGKYQLLDNYGDMFLGTASDVHAESIYAWRWVANQGWATQNTHQAFFAITSSIANVGDGWGMVKPSVDLRNAFEGNDARKIHILMEDGDYYPNLNTADGGFTFSVESEDYSSETRAAVKKYVVGGPDEDEVGFMSTGIDTDVIRYADVLLMYVEAVMGASNSTSDATALGYFNDVRTRAGLTEKTSVTRDELLQERRIEFAFEGQYLYDLVRILGEEGAIDYLSNVERGRYDGETLVPVTFTCDKVKFAIPTSEVDQDPLLGEDPVPYYE